MSEQPEAAVARPHRQPWLHELSICVDGNVTALSGSGGDIEPGTAHGLYADDVRVLSALRVVVEGESPSPVAARSRGARAQFLGSARNLGAAGSDPTVEVRRTRTVAAGGMVEEVTVASRNSEPVTATVELELAADGAPIAAVKAGHLVGPWPEPAGPPTPAGPASPAGWRVGSAVWDGTTVSFALPRQRVQVALDPVPAALDGADGVQEGVSGDPGVRARFEMVVPPGGATTLRVRVDVTRTAASLFDADAGSSAVPWDAVRVEAQDPRLGPLVRASVEDLRHLLLRDPQNPTDVFAAAGTPWYLTLFGRDSLWAARMMLPFGTDLAAGTLRALARRQGQVSDGSRAEQPGKIPHEVRRTAYLDPESGLSLPPLYYGTVDATALWVVLLVEAWRWGLPEDQVRALLPALEAALDWVTGEGAPDGDGILKYVDTTGVGLANQGWKDSEDSMRTRDGRVADAPIALVEAQAYAVQALEGGADLMDHQGASGAEQWRAAAGRLRTRIRELFWVDTDAGHHLALALDARGAPVDGLGSNMGHVLGTGTLTQTEARQVAETLTGAELLDEFGVRTLGSHNGGFNPIGYHTGSIWTHDTAIAALGLSQEGLSAEAGRVVRALVAAGAAFDNRFPELYTGQPLLGRPAPYPASCVPQAWAAASVGALVGVALGLAPDAPAGTLGVNPARPLPFGALRVGGLRFRGEPFTVEVNPDGDVSVDGVAGEVQVRTSA